MRDKHSPLKGNGAPEPGSISVCLNCGWLMVFTATGLREATAQEYFQMLRDETIAKTVAVIHERGLIYPLKGIGA